MNMETESVEASDDHHHSPESPMIDEEQPLAQQPEEEAPQITPFLPIETAEQRFDRSLSMDVVASAALTSPMESPLGSPTAGGADVSRAGRKRKANTRYMDEPSPVIKPVVRKSSTSRKSVPPPPPPPPVQTKKSAGDSKKVLPKEEEPLVVTGPPTFGSLLFGGKRSRKLSESLSDLDLEAEEELPEIVSEEDEIATELEPVKKGKETEESKDTIQQEPVSTGSGIIGVGEKMPGPYVASGAVGPTIHGLIKAPLVPPSEECSIRFPDLSTDDFQASLPARIPVPIELGGGGVLSLLPRAPLTWYRDEIPKLSAYFRKKMEAAGGLVPMAKPSIVSEKDSVSAAEKKAAALTAAQREERRRQKEEERRRLIEERNRRRERERLKQLYRQHWLALTKFPIEDDLLHSHKGIRRLGHPPAQARQVASPAIFWDCRLGPPDTLDIPSGIGSNVTELLDELFVVWNFCVHFNPLIGGSRFTLPQLVEGVMTRKLTPIVEQMYVRLLKVLEPWVEWQITTYLQAEQALESQLTKNRGRAKMHWTSLCQFRDLLFLGYSTTLGGNDSSNWLWRALYIAKAGVLLESIDYKTKEFLTTISTAFEEIDFEYKWIFDWELNHNWTFEQVPFEYRVKLLKLLIDRIVSLPVVKKAVDLWCEARTHIAAEIGAIEKDERKMTQRITLCQKLQAIIAQAPGEAAGIQLPMTEEELVQETSLRDALIRSKKSATVFFDNELAVRLEILGRDRHMNEYFQISSDRRLVFVRQRSVSHPHVVRYGIYDSLANMEQLIQSLDERGVRELNLKTELQKIRTNLYQDAVAAGQTRFDKFSIDWLGIEGHEGCGKNDRGLEQLDADAKKFPQLKFLRDCIDNTAMGFQRIQRAWNGGQPIDQEDDDDVTVDEGTLDDEEMEAEASDSDNTTSIVQQPFVPERDRFHETVVKLSDTITECLRNSLLGYARPDETTATTSSILIQFHIKTGMDLLRHLSIPVDKTEFEKLLNSVDPSSSKSMLQAATVFLDGLEALDEIVHAEVARHEAAVTSIEIWPATGGEKHAWKQFISARTDAGRIRDTPSPVGEGEEENQEEEEEQRGTFECDNCGKKFKFHILLGLHKLSPCKTRGRKPLPVDPVMEVVPLASKNGVLAIDRVANVEYPPLPSSRQEAAERAEKAEKAAAAAAAAAAAGADNQDATAAGPITTTEYVCEICGKVFPHNQGLAVHQTRWCIPEQQAQLLLTAQQAVGGVAAPAPAAPTEGPVDCPTCGKTFPTVQGLSIHQTRWCKGPENGEIPRAEAHPAEASSFDAIKSIHVEPVFRKHPAMPEDLVRIEHIISNENMTDEDSSRQPGFTPACYSISAISVAIDWYTKKLDIALKKYNSDSSHHSRSAKSRR